VFFDYFPLDLIKILKEELTRQYFVIQNDRHPSYKIEKFLNTISYEHWKEKTLNNLKVMMKNLEHVVLSEDALDSEESIQKYAYKLKLFPEFYEILVKKVFKNLACNEAGCHFRLTSNSMRLLKEFQMRYCVVI